MKDLTITLPNRVGALAELGRSLGTAGVNIKGICGIAMNGEGVLHIFVENITAARKAVEGVGASINHERDVVIWKYGEEGAVGKPGSLGEVSQKFADAGINIDLIYQGENDIVIFGVDKVDLARNLVG
ncbi:MAG: ACT domain-containing protein [Candidatus Kariarchaeaceae archaeon]|jgi:hypothetical protein